MMRRPREHETSVKARLIDLLETYPEQWFSIKDLVDEYSERFGPVKVDTIRQAVFRELGRRDDDCAMFVRYVAPWMTAGIEVCWAISADAEEVTV
jgi:hypothetical protein